MTRVRILVAAVALTSSGIALAASGTEPIRSTFCRQVPERADDFAWENDLVAFRAYGPALRANAENSGIDCWLKRVGYPIIDKWYAHNAEGRSYHQDYGEGLDCYHVGSSAGTGGTGLWLNGKREPLETYVRCEVYESTSERSRFKLTYEREIGGVIYGEEKTITIELGERLFLAHSVFTKNGRFAAGLPVCVGVTTHDGRAASFSNRAEGWIACWEKIEDSELGTAVRMASHRIREIKPVDSAAPDEGHILILAITDEGGAIDYEAGYAWTKAGALTSRSEWEAYLARRSLIPNKGALGHGAHDGPTRHSQGENSRARFEIPRSRSPISNVPFTLSRSPAASGWGRGVRCDHAGVVMRMNQAIHA